jgi:hypothetical protein
MCLVLKKKKIMKRVCVLGLIMMVINHEKREIKER